MEVPIGPQSQSIITVVTTVATHDDADEIAASIVDSSLAACVQIDGPIRSIYRWDGQTCRSVEYRLTIKTAQKAWPRLKAQLAEIHPYDEPEIVMIKVDDISDGYREWVIDQTTTGS